MTTGYSQEECCPRNKINLARRNNFISALALLGLVDMVLILVGLPECSTVVHVVRETVVVDVRMPVTTRAKLHADSRPHVKLP